MWNGFLKITAMVGVIGVGLFAVFHAQKGLNFTLPDFGSGKADANAVAKTIAPPGNTADLVASTPDEPLDPAFELAETKQTAATRTQSRPSPSSLDSDANEIEAPVSSRKRSGTSKPPIEQPAVVKQTAAVMAKVDEAFDDEVTKPADNFNDKSKNTTFDKSSQQSNVNNIESAEGVSLSDTALNHKNQPTEEPFDTDFATSPSSTPAELPVDTVPSKTVTDFDSDLSPPPRSKRAMRKDPAADVDNVAKITTEPATISEPILSPPTELDSNPNVPKRSDIERSKPSKTQSSTALDFSTSDDPPTDSLRNLPTYSNNASREEPFPTTEPTVPRPLNPPSELKNERPIRTTRQSRESSSRRKDAEIRQVDMVGDGVAGDASQRGLQQPRLTIEKKAPQQAVLGQPLVYEIVVKNIGGVDAHNVVIEDRIPKGAELQGTIPQAEMSGRRLIWNQPILKPNEETRISIKVTPTQEGSIGSDARVYFATVVTAEIVVSAPQLDFSVKAPREVRLGQRFDLIYTLKNVGKVDATNIVVRDLLPEELKNETGHDLECPLGTIAPDEVREVVLPVTAIRPGSVINKAILTADTGINKSKESPIDIIGEVLVLTRSGQNRLYVEKPVVFSNSIRNEGNQKAEKVRVSEVVPAGMQFVEASDGGKLDTKSGSVVWIIGPLDPGADKSVKVKYVPRDTGTFDSKITALGNAGSTAAINATVDVVGKAELKLETSNATGSVTIGDQIVYKIQLNNTGTATANNVRLTVRLPSELRLVTVKGMKFNQDRDDIIFETIARFDPKDKAVCELVLEPMAEAETLIQLETSAEHLQKPAIRTDSISISRDLLK